MKTPRPLYAFLRRVTPWVVGVLIASGCLTIQRGMVVVETAADGDPRSVQLETLEGRSFALRSAEEIELLRSLDGCSVEVSGPRAARSLVVQSWTVLDAGDGSVPYVGALRQHGSNLVIDDRTSGMPLVLDDPSAARLGPYAGSVVMISGYVIGAQLLHVVNFRVLVK